MKPWSRNGRSVVHVGAPLALLLIGLLPHYGVLAIPPEAKFVGEKVCVKCHDVESKHFGHTLHAEANVLVDESLSAADGHAIAEAARHAMLHSAPRLRSALVHVDLCGHSGTDHHTVTAHHF